MPRYVQHRIGQGNKWKVDEEYSTVWAVVDNGIDLILPKSEYVICAPPAQWVDVSEDCEVASSGITLVHCESTVVQGGIYGYRIRKEVVYVSNEACCSGVHTAKSVFIVERKVR